MYPGVLDIDIDFFVLFHFHSVQDLRPGKGAI